jgi:hypothetical protein
MCRSARRTRPRDVLASVLLAFTLGPTSAGNAETAYETRADPLRWDGSGDSIEIAPEDRDEPDFWVEAEPGLRAGRPPRRRRMVQRRRIVARRPSALAPLPPRCRDGNGRHPVRTPCSAAALWVIGDFGPRPLPPEWVSWPNAGLRSAPARAASLVLLALRRQLRQRHRDDDPRRFEPFRSRSSIRRLRRPLRALAIRLGNASAISRRRLESRA